MKLYSCSLWLLLNDEVQQLPTGGATHIPKGIYRYASHEQANRHWLECVVKGMVRNAS